MSPGTPPVLAHGHVRQPGARQPGDPCATCTLPRDRHPTVPLDEFLPRYAADDNEWWRLQSGDMQNLFDEALTRIEQLEARLADGPPRTGLALAADQTDSPTPGRG